MQFTIESPDLDRIKKEAGTATKDAVNLLWLVLNNEASDRRSGVRTAIDISARSTKIGSPSAALDNYAPESAFWLRFDGAASVNLTGLQPRAEGHAVIVLVLGTGTITLKHNSASSDATNRILLQSGADLAVATNRAVMLVYQNARWREVKWA